MNSFSFEIVRSTQSHLKYVFVDTFNLCIFVHLLYIYLLYSLTFSINHFISWYICDFFTFHQVGFLFLFVGYFGSCSDVGLPLLLDLVLSNVHTFIGLLSKRIHHLTYSCWIVTVWGLDLVDYLLKFYNWHYLSLFSVDLTFSYYWHWLYCPLCTYHGFCVSSKSSIWQRFLKDYSRPLLQCSGHCPLLPPEAITPTEVTDLGRDISTVCCCANLLLLSAAMVHRPVQGSW